MSGPKVSVYDLTPEQRAIIAANLEKMMREKQRHQALISHMLQCREKLSALEKTVKNYQYIASESREHLLDSSLDEEIKSVGASVDESSQELQEFMKSDDNDLLEKQLKKAVQNLESIERKCKSIEKISVTVAKDLQKELTLEASGLIGFEDEDTVEESSVSDNEKEELIVEMKQLNEFMHYEFLPENLRESIIQINEREKNIPGSLISSFRAVEVAPLKKQCQDFRTEWDKYGKEFTDLIERYKVLTAESGNSNIPAITFNRNAIAQLLVLIEQEMEKLKQSAEQEYIVNTVSDVMGEMGYKIWGKRRVNKRNGRSFESNLYQYSEETAINVIYSDDGKITMEVGKIDSVDRLPDSSESKTMVGEMKRFCSDFNDIEHKLMQKGVVLGSRMRMSPPEEIYAQIININDYMQTGTCEVRRTQKRDHKKMSSISGNN